MFKAMLFLILCVVFVSSYEISLRSTQKVCVHGFIRCGRRCVQNQKVELFEADTIDPDDFLMSTLTNRRGEFTVCGSEHEFNRIRPYLKIRHYCQLKAPCYRTTKIRIPESAINGDVHYVEVQLDGSDEAYDDVRPYCIGNGERYPRWETVRELSYN